MIKIKVASKPCKLKINGIPVLLANITKGEWPVTPPTPGEYSSLVDHAITDRSKTGREENTDSTIGTALIGIARIV